MLFFTKRRRGLSIVISSAMLLTGVVIMGTGLVAWANGNLKVYETNLSITATNSTNKINEFLSIENVWYCKVSCPGPPATNPPSLNITVTNTGSNSLSVKNINLVNSTHNLNFAPSASMINLKPGKSGSWQQTYAWKSQVPINIYITTTRNSIFTTQVTPP